jgi:hypothetical protein
LFEHQSTIISLLLNFAVKLNTIERPRVDIVASRMSDAETRKPAMSDYLFDPTPVPAVPVRY